jgi:uncharacterized delta-60 repeat protein
MKRLALFSAAAVGGVVLSVLPAWATTVDLDPTFAGDGTTSIQLSKLDAVYGVVADGDASYAVGSSQAAFYERSHAFVARLTDSGALDSTFSGDGRVLLHLGSWSTATDAALTDDGDLLVAADNMTGNNHHAVMLCKVLPDGLLDPSFSGDGVASIPVGQRDAVLNAQVVVDPTGSAWLAWSTWRSNKGPGHYHVARIDPNGHLIKSFGHHGVQTLDVGHYDALFAAAADGSDLVFTGSSTSSKGATSATIARVSPDGTIAKHSFTLWSSKLGTAAVSVDVDNAGRIVGTMTPESGPGWGAVRLLPNLHLDSSFSNDGIARHSCGCHSLAASLVDDELILVGSSRAMNSATQVRGFTPNGRWDTSLNHTNLDLSPRDEFIWATAVDPSGRLLLGGQYGRRSANPANSYSQTLVARMTLS